MIFACLLVKANAGEQIGSGNFWGLVQRWNLVDDSRPVETITGTLVEPPHRYTGYFGDGDWCFYVKPNPESDWCIENSKRDLNVEPGPGLIELEINTGGNFDFESKFPAYSNITAKGWWVEDSPHRDKTELHPIISLQSGSPQGSMIFVGQDQTSRFDTKTLLVIDRFDFPVQGELVTRNMNFADGLLERIKTADLLEESIRFDYFVGADLPTWPLTRARTDMQFGNVELEVEIPFYFPTFPTSTYLTRPAPFYLGEFHHSRVDALVETLDYRVDRNADGTQIVRVTMRAEITVPPDVGGTGKIAASHWRYVESPNGIANDVTVDRSDEGTHWVQYDVAYSPALNWNNTSSRVEVIAATRPEDWYPGKDSEPVNGVNGPLNRAWVTDTRWYFLVPSSIELTSELRQSWVSRNGEDRECPCGFELEVSEDILRDVDVEGPNWLVQPLRDRKGNELNVLGRQGLQKIPSHGELEINGFVFRVDPTNPRHLLVDFKDYEWVGADIAIWSSSNQAAFRVHAQVETGVGEHLAESKMIRILPCISPLLQPMHRLYPVVRLPGRLGLPWTWDSVERTLAGMVEAKKAGILGVDWTWPDSSLPDARLKRAFPHGFRPLGHPETYAKNLPPEGIELLKAYEKFLEGKPLSDYENSLLEATTRASQKLPKINLEAVSHRR
jgi:hypothetical protein